MEKETEEKKGRKRIFHCAGNSGQDEMEIGVIQEAIFEETIFSLHDLARGIRSATKEKKITIS